MEMFEKVEKLRERANVTFEEAKEALFACDGDLLDAMVYLEKQGKVKQPEQSTFSTSYEKQEKYVNVEDTVKSQEKPDGAFKSIDKVIRGFIKKCRGNYFCVKKDDEIKFKIPALLFVIILVSSWEVVIPLMIVLLFAGAQFSFYGKDELKEVNDFFDKAGKFTTRVKDTLAREGETDNDSETTDDDNI